ncbi:hypothetical protein LMIY3S_00548 [Labrys miyagiensis]
MKYTVLAIGFILCAVFFMPATANAAACGPGKMEPSCVRAHGGAQVSAPVVSGDVGMACRVSRGMRICPGVVATQPVQDVPGCRISRGVRACR